MDVTIIHGDCVDILPQLAPQVRCIVTSPPYYGLRNYGIPPSAWPDIEYTPMIGLPSVSIPAQTVCLGDEATPAAYVAHLVYVFRLARAVLTDDGVAWLNLGDSYAGSGKGQTKDGCADPKQPKLHGMKLSIPVIDVAPKNLLGIPWMVAFALQADGWVLRSDVVWSKPNAMPESVKDRPTKAHEYVFLLAKSAHYYYDAAAVAEPYVTESNVRNKANEKHNAAVLSPIGKGEREWNSGNGRNRRSVWSIPTQPLKEAHYAPMPEALAEVCIKAGSRAGDTVLDMFGGSGTVARIAERFSRRAISIDVNESYIDMQHKRTDGVQKALLLDEAA